LFRAEITQKIEMTAYEKKEGQAFSRMTVEPDCKDRRRPRWTRKGPGEDCEK